MRATLLAALHGIVLIVSWTAVGTAHGQELVEQDENLADRPISSIRLVGVDPDVEGLVRNNIRTAVGDAYHGDTVRGDVSRVYNLGRFMFVTAEAQLRDDGSVEIIFTLTMQPTIQSVQTIGNRAISDQELRSIIRQVPGGPRDQYLIEKAKRDIRAAYREKGYYLTDVAVDESNAVERGLLIFAIIEGPRVTVRVVEFAGAEAFTAKRLAAQVKTRTHMLLLRQGVLDEEVIATDMAALDRFYKDRGFLDVRVGHTVALSPDNTEAKVTFLIDEGRRFTLRSVRTENRVDPEQPLSVFTHEQLAALLEIKTGDVYSRDKLRKSLGIVEDAYGIMGYIDVLVTPTERRSGPEAEVDLVLAIDEGGQYKVGAIQINGNFLTKDKVIRRLLRVKPGRPYDSVQLAESVRRIRQTRLFNDVRVTVQDPDPFDPEYRDLLVEVKERNTGSVNFGIAVGSDSGVFGDFSLNQTNFDIADVPRSFRELVTGRAFRGAGQRFSMSFRPGDELFQYAISLTEPHLFETDYALTVGGFWRQRVFRDFDEERVRLNVRLARRLGDIWEIAASTRIERVELTDIALDSPTELFRDAGPDQISSVSLALTRTTVRTITRPGRGSRFELSVEQVGVLGGDFDFTKVQADYAVFLTLSEDFLGRKSILKLNSRVSRIFGSRAPIYEQFYLGGRSFRGFDFREISPKGIRIDGEPSDEPVGGEWLFFVGAQYEFPLLTETVTGVFFLDSGTVLDSVGFNDYRVTLGGGIRLYIAALGPVPIAFDFGFPIQAEDTDEERVLSFSAELPF